MSLKFEKNRSVSSGYSKIPSYYTGILHPNNSEKELVIMDDFGKHLVCAYRNNEKCSIGITFLLKKVDNGFIFKDKIIKYETLIKVG